MGLEFVPPHNPSNYLPTIGNTQDQALGTEKFRQNQALFRKYTAIDGDLKNQMIAAVEPVFLSPLVDQLTGFGQVFTLNMLQHIFSSYRMIEKNRPRGKRCQDNESLRPRVTPGLIDRTIGKGERICASRGADDF